MTTKLKWRLSKLPSVEEISILVKDGIITKDEAHKVLFSLETEEDRDKESLQEEIKFLRELVSKLSNSRTEIVRQIEYIEKPYRKNNWWNGYEIYCASPTTTASYTTTGTTNAMYVLPTNSGPDFTDIKTF